MQLPAAAVDADRLCAMRAALAAGQPLAATLHRDVHVFAQGAARAATSTLPHSFYNVRYPITIVCSNNHLWFLSISEFFAYHWHYIIDLLH